MSKIKVVQIALCSYDGDTYGEYLDDQGRVWFLGGHQEKTETDQPGAVQSAAKYVWVPEWKQLELPDEPVLPYQQSETA